MDRHHDPPPTPPPHGDPAASVGDLADALVRDLLPGDEVVVPIAAGEPAELISALEDRSAQLHDVTVHQMHAMHDHPYLHGSCADHLRHASWFLSEITRPAYAAGGCDLVPADFSEMPRRLLERKPALVLAAATLPDDDGWFSLGVSADYVAPLIGRVPFVLEASHRMPWTHGSNRIHRSDVRGWFTSDAPLPTKRRDAPLPADRLIGDHIADRIPDGTTIQIGSGSSPRAVARALRGHRDLGIHTELFSDELMELVICGAANGARKTTDRGCAITTFALGSERLYSWLDRNPAVRFRGVDEVNDPRRIAREAHFVAVNGAIQIDLFGQCASETIGPSYYTGSGGQADFARGAMFAHDGTGFTALHATANEGRISRIVPTLDSGAVVTTTKNIVDQVVTEFGVAELRGRSVQERARRLIAIADPAHRDGLRRAASRLGFVPARRPSV